MRTPIFFRSYAYNWNSDGNGGVLMNCEVAPGRTNSSAKSDIRR